VVCWLGDWGMTDSMPGGIEDRMGSPDPFSMPSE
jgi:hypothetical protein